MSLHLRLLSLIAAGILLAGCQKRVDTNVAGSEEARLDQYAAQLEELRTRIQGGQASCAELCAHAREVCGISTRVCEITARHTDRQDRCVSSQEDCATANDRCSSCG